MDWDRLQRAEAPWYDLSSCTFGSLWDFGDTGHRFSAAGSVVGAACQGCVLFSLSCPCTVSLSPFVTLVMYGGWGRTTLKGHMC